VCELGVLAREIGSLVLVRGEADEAFSVDVDAQRVVAGDHDVDAEIELVALDQQRIVQVTGHHNDLRVENISRIVDDVDSAALRGTSGLDDPVVESQGPVARLELSVAHDYLVLDCFLLRIETFAELRPLLWQDKRLRQEVKVLLRKFLLHFDYVDCEAILSCELHTRREVVDLLIMVKAFVEVAFTLGVGPEHVPVVTVGLDKAVDFEQEADKFGIAFEHFVVQGGLPHLRIGVGSGSRLRCLLLCEVGLVVDQRVDALNQIFVALRHLLNGTALVFLRD